MEENLKFPIPNAILEPYIIQAVSTAITAALGDGTKLVEQAVFQALSTKVNSDGVIDPRYQSDNRFNLCDVIAANKIREIAKKTIVEMSNKLKPQIEDAVKNYLKASHSDLAKVLVDGLIKGLRCSWNVKINLEDN